MIDADLDGECYKTCVACQSYTNLRKLCECMGRARQAQDGVPNEFQIQQLCKKFPDCDLPKPTPPQRPPDIP